MRVVPFASFLGVLALGLACSTPEDGRNQTSGPPGPDGTVGAGGLTPTWQVGEAFARTCGTLECHGSKYRNMRVYGRYALRLEGLPDQGGSTYPEYLATYRSIIGLEPEVMATVTREKTGFDRLSLVRKATGLDEHRGGNRMQPGSAMDRCVRSWLRSAVDDDACRQASTPAPFVDDAGSSDASASDSGADGGPRDAGAD